MLTSVRQRSPPSPCSQDSTPRKRLLPSPRTTPLNLPCYQQLGQWAQQRAWSCGWGRPSGSLSPIPTPPGQGQGADGPCRLSTEKGGGFTGGRGGGFTGGRGGTSFVPSLLLLPPTLEPVRQRGERARTGEIQMGQDPIPGPPGTLGSAEALWHVPPTKSQSGLLSSDGDSLPLPASNSLFSAQMAPGKWFCFRPGSAPVMRAGGLTGRGFKAMGTFK